MRVFFRWWVSCIAALTICNFNDATASPERLIRYTPSSVEFGLLQNFANVRSEGYLFFDIPRTNTETLPPRAKCEVRPVSLARILRKRF